jgi:hypothetical protein
MNEVEAKWYREVAEYIDDNIEEFYSQFYSNSSITKAGNQWRLEPCPVCGHKHCCTIKIGVNCFSCQWTGGHIGAWMQYAVNTLGITKFEARTRLEEFTGILHPRMSEEDYQKQLKAQRKQEILKAAEAFYHAQLLNCEDCFVFEGKRYKPYDYLTEVRKRKHETILDMKMGFAINYKELQTNLLGSGYTMEEIKDAKVWVPQHLFVFFYKDPFEKDIKRLNTKNPFNIKFDPKDEEPIQGYSTGVKIPLFSNSFSFKEPFEIVEGEHDFASLLENGFSNVCCLGGNPKKEDLEILEYAQDMIYTFFDNDEKGRSYVQLINDLFPHKQVKNILYPENYKDPDEYFTQDESPIPKEQLRASAKMLETDKYKILHKKGMWIVADRKRRLEFTPKGVSKGVLTGRANYYENNQFVNRDDNTSLSGCCKSIRPLNYFLADAVESYLESNLEEKTINELIDIYRVTQKKNEVISTIAHRMVDKNNDKEDIVKEIRKKLQRTSEGVNLLDEILKEANDISNRQARAGTRSFIPKIKITQYYNIRNNDAYFYFNFLKDDGDADRVLPYLLRNDKTLIRLDLLKKKDDQCLVLIDGKYELPVEVPKRLVEDIDCSLTQENVIKYINGEIPPEKISPSTVIRDIEDQMKQFYISEDPVIYKILAMFSYFTYYYEAIKRTPYLFINGQKGSGKSELDFALKLLCFNARQSVSTSDAALYRMVGADGGTMILDEIETLGNRTKGADSVLGAILKGGYNSHANVYRCNKDNDGIESFDTFCPKIISNIFGLDDIIADRCLPINTYRVKITSSNRPADSRILAGEYYNEIKELTSRCCFSAMENFQKLYSIYKDNLFEDNVPRWSQILTPMLAIAKLVDLAEYERAKCDNPGLTEFEGEYEKALKYYYKRYMKPAKEDVEEITPEYIVKKVVHTVASELYGIIPRSQAQHIDMDKRKFKEPILFNIEEGWFELTTLHIKCLYEEQLPGEAVYTRFIPKWLKTAFKFEEDEITRKLVNIDNEDLCKEFKGSMKAKVNNYRFFFSRILDPDVIVDFKLKKQESTSEPEKF